MLVVFSAQVLLNIVSECLCILDWKANNLVRRDYSVHKSIGQPRIGSEFTKHQALAIHVGVVNANIKTQGPGRASKKARGVDGGADLIVNRKGVKADVDLRATQVGNVDCIFVVDDDNSLNECRVCQLYVNPSGTGL